LASQATPSLIEHEGVAVELLGVPPPHDPSGMA
jgi:hypothetical protein